jgi:hypothetical protein
VQRDVPLLATPFSTSPVSELENKILEGFDDRSEKGLVLASFEADVEHSSWHAPQISQIGGRLLQMNNIRGSSY